MSLHNYEKETIILTNEDDHFYSVYTYNEKLKRKLADFTEKYPYLCELIKEDKYGGKTYKVVKDRLKINLRAPTSMSEDRKKEFAERTKLMWAKRKEKI